MPKLYNISCYYDIDSSEYYLFHPKSNTNVWEMNVWEGQILVNDKGWFEGIINYPDNGIEISKNLFIYGVFIPNVGITIIENNPYKAKSPLRQLSLGIYTISNEFYRGTKRIGSDKLQRVDKNYRFSISDVTCDKEMLSSFIETLKGVRSDIPFRDLYLEIFRNRELYKNKIRIAKKEIRVETSSYLGEGAPVFDKSVNVLGGASCIRTGKRRHLK